MALQALNLTTGLYEPLGLVSEALGGVEGWGLGFRVQGLGFRV